MGWKNQLTRMNDIESRSVVNRTWYTWSPPISELETTEQAIRIIFLKQF